MSTPSLAGPAARYRWFAAGDINGFFGLMIDNISVLSFLAGLLVMGFQFPADIVYGRMFPGTAFGVLFGDLVYTVMAVRLARRTGNPGVTAMPLGLDTPSTIGLALTVLGPAFVAMKARGMPPADAALATWRLGMATMVLIGIAKLALSFAGAWVQRMVPAAGLLGSIAGIAVVLIGFVPLIDIFGMPLVGMIALGLVLSTLVARIELPFGVPGVLGAVLVGTGLYYVLAPAGLSGGGFAPPHAELHLGLPVPTLGFVRGLRDALAYLPIALPFGILTVVGGINVTESARVAGDDFKARDILLTEAAATLIAGVCGGVAQTTPYIGHPAYKKMGSRAGYTLLTGLFIGLGGMLGYIGFIVELIPRAVLAPILIFVALDITVQAFQACPPRHAAAVTLAFFPSVARLLQIELSNFLPAGQFGAALAAPGAAFAPLATIVALGNGFILTAMLWGGFLAELIDRRVRQAAAYLAVSGGLTFFGIIHSATAEGTMYLPWRLAPPSSHVAYQIAAAYLVLALLVLVLPARSAAARDERAVGGRAG